MVFLETAELRAKKRMETTMDYWRNNANNVIESNEFALLQGKGSISNTTMEQLALDEYEKFNAQRKAWEAKHADKQDEDELKKLESKVKNKHEK
jgi:hypothetical protein